MAFSSQLVPGCVDGKTPVRAILEELSASSSIARTAFLLLIVLTPVGWPCPLLLEVLGSSGSTVLSVKQAASMRGSRFMRTYFCEPCCLRQLYWRRFVLGPGTWYDVSWSG